MKKTKKTRTAGTGPTLQYLAGLLLYGSNGVIASFIHKTSLEIVLLRTLLGFLLLAAIFYGTGGRIRQEKKRDILYTLLSGAAMGVDWLLLFEAYARIGVSLGMIINYCGPVLVMLAARIFWKQTMRPVSWCALALAMAGAVLISWEASGQTDSAGFLCAVLSAFFYAAMVLLNRQADGLSGLGRVVLQLAGALAIVTAYAAIRGGVHLMVPAGEIWAVLWLGLLNTGLASFWYFSAIGILPVREVSVMGYLEPLSALIFSAVFLHEKMTHVQMLGAALILSGTAAVELAKKKK